MNQLLITNARLVNEGETRDADVLIKGDRIQKIGSGIEAGDIVDVLHQDGKVRSYEFSLANFPEINMREGYVVLNPPPEVTAQDEQGNVH